ncbi:hypothetical protein BJP36_41005 [Moorena producens JHB]|uniref:Uncharacterized protein n=1 Tax=Moorena producens (strain JHB) TaxID=1454205 RepID=A0A9Q9SSC9_MOOP1|nr:hypothetical protein [Moorena producens]WAN68747.1 hypothetical protein BJP36_41005 [Moorena producens JHB]
MVFSYVLLRGEWGDGEMGRWGVGNRESGIGNRESGIGSRESEVGNRESGVGRLIVGWAVAVA